MRGQETLRDWELDYFKRKFNVYLKCSQKIIDLTNEDLCPANVCKILSSLGYQVIHSHRDNFKNCQVYLFKNEACEQVYFTYEFETFKMILEKYYD